VGLCAAELPRDVRIAQRARPSGRIHILVMVCSGCFELGSIRVRAAVEVTARRGCSVGLCVAELPRDVRVAQRARPSGRIHILVMVCSGRFELGSIQDRKSTSAMS
jgi:uncharacterized metal-binding protein